MSNQYLNLCTYILIASLFSRLHENMNDFFPTHCERFQNEDMCFLAQNLYKKFVVFVCAKKWYFVSKILLTSCSSVREKLLKFKAEAKEFAKCLKQSAFLTCPWGPFIYYVSMFWVFSDPPPPPLSSRVSIWLDPSP